MNIVIAGKNNIAVEMLDFINEEYPEHKVFGVINSNDNGFDSFQRSFYKRCRELLIPVVPLEDVYNLEDTIFLSLEFDRIIKPDLFCHSRLYNIHFSLLPKYKGMYTSAWPIMNGESETGVTLHKIDKGIDTGDIIDQIKFRICESETAKSLYIKYIAHGLKLAKSKLDDLLNNEVVGKPQQSIGASYYSKKSINYENIIIDFNKTAYEIARQVNALTFRDYQLPKVFESDIFGVKILEGKSNKKPGELISENEFSYTISTIDYDLCLFKDRFEELLEACREGDLKRIKKIDKVERLILEKNKVGWSPIIVAAYNGHIDVVDYLLSKGASINDINNKGTTVLMYAKNYLEKTGDIGFVNSIIERGADIEKRDFNGCSVKDYVRKTGNEYSIPVFC